MNARILFVVIAVLAFAVDRITKLAVQQRIAVGERIEVIDGLLELRHVHNRGIAFGMFSGAGGLVVIGTVLVGVLLFTFLLRVEPEDLLTVVGGALITGGAMGNLVDRIQYRYVIDFLHLPNYPTFNVADICITVGVVLVIISQLAAVRREQRAAKAEAPTAGDADEASP